MFKWMTNLWGIFFNTHKVFVFREKKNAPATTTTTKITEYLWDMCVIFCKCYLLFHNETVTLSKLKVVFWVRITVCALKRPLSAFSFFTITICLPCYMLHTEHWLDSLIIATGSLCVHLTRPLKIHSCWINSAQKWKRHIRNVNVINFCHEMINHLASITIVSAHFPTVRPVWAVQPQLSLTDESPFLMALCSCCFH